MFLCVTENTFYVCASDTAEMRVGHSRRGHRGTQVHPEAQDIFANTPLGNLPHNSQIAPPHILLFKY